MMSILGILDVLRGTPLLYAPSGVRLTDSTQFHFCSFAAELVPHKNPPTKTFAANDSNGREEERERPAAPPAAEYVLVFLCSPLRSADNTGKVRDMCHGHGLPWNFL